jgi:polar amino acid transport system ATP-binding protein
MPAFLTIDGVSKRFGTNEVLKGVDLHVAEHEVISVIGASGSGKSTLLRCINGLVAIDEGAIVVDGFPVTRLDSDLNRLRRHVGIVFQNFNLFPHMTVLENVTLALRKVLRMSKTDANDRAEVLLQRIGLWEKHADYPDRLSGGQQQRVAIVRALAMRPKLMLLDEVTSALDPELVFEVLDIVRELAAEGMTMLLATHEMGFAREVSDRVCFLDAGVMAEVGPPQQIFHEPTNPRTAQFLQRIIAAGRM